ncbi:HAD family hydrolase [Sorangium sp. So ce117]|uniref:HAD family hydrolase n=1 Tax=Sorangium sp. So ce117 TaxID=3133277 RepID=UPI003F62FDD0
MPHAILFDLDHTLTDRVASIQRYAEQFALDFEVPSDVAPERLSALIVEADGKGYAPRGSVFAALQRELAWTRAPELERLAGHWDAHYPLATVGNAGFRSMLEALGARGFLLGVVSNGDDQRQRRKLERLGIRSMFQSVVISESFGVKKPHPSIFQQALRELGCLASEAWFVGDHPHNDILGAAAAGLTPVWLRGVHDWPSAAPEPRYSIATLTELLTLVPDLSRSP